MPWVLPDEDLSLVADALAERWSALKSGRILITGASGFVGTWMLESLLFADSKFRLGLSVTAITRNATKLRRRYFDAFSSGSLDVVEGSLESIDFPSGPYSHLLHLATGSHTPGHWSHGGFFIRDQIIAERLAEFCLKAGVSQILFTSSGAVYGRGDAPINGFSEDYAASPGLTDAASAYGLGKRSSEYIFNCLGQASCSAPKIARLFSFSGPLIQVDAGLAFGNFIRDAIRGEHIVIRGDGTAKRSYLYAADMAIWIWSILLDHGRDSLYNVGGSQVVSIGELADLVASELGASSKVIIKNELPASANTSYFPDVSKARLQLGLQETVNLSAAIQKTAQWMRESKSL